MLKRTYLGLEIRERQLHAIAVQRRGKHVALTGGGVRPLPEGILQPGFSRPNVTAPEPFVTAVRELVAPLVKGDNRIAVALPDQAGRLFLLDVETPFKSRSEGAEIIRWQLKDALPDRSRQVAIDYQVLEEKESGHKKVLCATINQDVLAQYEALIEQAGFAPAVVDFHSLALYNAYWTKIDLGRDFILVGVDGCQLSLMVFANQILCYQRSRRVERDSSQIFQELNRSLVTCRRTVSNFNRMPVYLHSDWDEEGLGEAVASAFDQGIQRLVSPVSKLMNGHQADFRGADAGGMAAALGVVERLMPRVA